MRRLIVVLSVSLLGSGLAQADVFNMPSGQTSLQLVTVGDPGNLPDTSGYGSVPYVYQMGTYDVTVGQYCQFLNAVAATDTYGLYNFHMAVDFPTIKIIQSGGSGSYGYMVGGSDSQAANCPIFDVSWGDAARFCNWLQNGQPATGVENSTTTEDGAYSLNGATTPTQLMAVLSPSHSGANAAQYFLPTVDEWYKAAYYKTGGTNAGYWSYSTQSNNVPSNVFSSTGTNNANYLTLIGSTYTDPTNYLTPVGAFAASPGPYGTFDQDGDLYQWNETAYNSLTREEHGGYWGGYIDDLVAGAGLSVSDPTVVNNAVGFRVAASEPVPEPASIGLLLAGAVALGIWKCNFSKTLRSMYCLAVGDARGWA